MNTHERRRQTISGVEPQGTRPDGAASEVCQSRTRSAPRGPLAGTRRPRPFLSTLAEKTPCGWAAEWAAKAEEGNSRYCSWQGARTEEVACPGAVEHHHDTGESILAPSRSSYGRRGAEEGAPHLGYGSPACIYVTRGVHFSFALYHVFFSIRAFLVTALLCLLGSRAMYAAHKTEKEMFLGSLAEPSGGG